MTLSLKPMTTTLVGGAVFLLPLIVVLAVGKGMALMVGGPARWRRCSRTDRSAVSHWSASSRC